MKNQIKNFGNDNRGAKPKAPDSALTMFMYKNKISTYYLQKNGFLNAGRIHNRSHKDVNTYTIGFLKGLADAVHMKWTTVGRKLLKLQKDYPPISNDNRKQNTYNHKNKKNA